MKGLASAWTTLPWPPGHPSISLDAVVMHLHGDTYLPGSNANAHLQVLQHVRSDSIGGLQLSSQCLASRISAMDIAPHKRMKALCCYWQLLL